MNDLDFAGLKPIVAEKLSPMVDDILRAYASKVRSFHVVGSALIADYDEKLSDINSVVVLHSMDLGFVEFLAPLGKKYGKKRIAAPLVMTPEYIMSSLDTFPIEFLDFKLIHKTVYGDDILRGLEIDRKNLRLQCEREVKTKLINVRQGYISSLGKKELLEAALVRSITGSMALFRAIIVLLGKEPPAPRADVIAELGAATELDAGIFQKLLMLKTGQIKPKEHELRSLFEQYFQSLESTEKIIDALPV